MEHRYSLEKYSNSNSKHICPNCKSNSKTFVLYVDNETKEYISKNVGRCDRESKCGYHYTPKQFFSDNGNIEDFENRMASYTPSVSKPISFIDPKNVLQSMENYENNPLVKFLDYNFNRASVKSALEKYFVGTTKEFGGSVIFWQIDIENRVRNGKVMLYDQTTGKRSKTSFTSIPKLLGLKDFNSVSCFFGEHLLADSNKPVAIVESEKTAIIASLLFDEYIWLACSGKSNLTDNRCKVLKSRKVILFPDSDGFDLWEKKAENLGFDISSSLKDREPGFDLADCFLEILNDQKDST